MNTLLSIIVAVASLVIIVAVTIQESEQAGLGTIDGSIADANWGTHTGTSRKQKLQRLTTICAVIDGIALIAIAALG